VDLILVSEDLTIENGEISLVSMDTGGVLMPSRFETARVNDNRIRNAPELPTGEIQLIFTNCLVLRRKTGDRHRIRMFRVVTSLSDQDRRARIVEVTLGFLGFARVEVVDDNDNLLTREHVFGVALPGMSIEARGPENSPLDVLLPPGEYRAYLADPRRIQVTFVIRERDNDLKTIRILDSDQH